MSRLNVDTRRLDGWLHGDSATNHDGFTLVLQGRSPKGRTMRFEVKLDDSCAPRLVRLARQVAKRRRETAENLAAAIEGAQP
jgi:hypothetical protein